MIPGEIIPAEGSIDINVGRRTVKIAVANTGDRPIQVGSHYHFFETNDALGANPELVNQDPYERGWMLRIRLKDPAEIENLLSPEAYEKLIG